MSNVPPIFVINLTRSPDRRAHMSKMLDALDLKYEFIEAIDGEQLTDDQVDKVYDEQMAVEYGGSVLNVGVIATYMSHVKALQTIIDRDIPEALVFEDDIVVSPDIKPFFERRDRLPRDYGILSLSIHRDYDPEILGWYRKSWNIYKDYTVGLPSGWLCGAYGYLIQASYIKEFMQYKYLILRHYDSQLFNVFYSGSIYYAFKSKSIIEANELFSISERRTDGNRRISIKDKSLNSRIREEKKVPPKSGIVHSMSNQVQRIIFGITVRFLIYWFLPKRFPNRIPRSHKEFSQSRWKNLRYFWYLHVK